MRNNRFSCLLPLPGSLFQTGNKRKQQNQLQHQQQLINTHYQQHHNNPINQISSYNSSSANPSLNSSLTSQQLGGYPNYQPHHQSNLSASGGGVLGGDSAMSSMSNATRASCESVQGLGIGRTIPIKEVRCLLYSWSVFLLFLSLVGEIP